MDGMDMRNRSFAAGAFALTFLAAGAALAQDADLVAEGEKVFRRCSACHMVGEGAQNRVGPELSDVIGRTAGAVEGFRYSAAMTEAGQNGLVWDEETIYTYLEKPREFVKGTNMAFAGLPKTEDRKAVIAYIVANQTAPMN